MEVTSFEESATMWMLSGSIGAASHIFQVLLTRLLSKTSVATSASISDKPSPTVPSEMTPLASAQFSTDCVRH